MDRSPNRIIRRARGLLASCPSGIRTAGVVAVIVVQVAVPLIALMGQPPTRFGFQMYSGRGDTDVTITTRGGDRVRLDQAMILVGGLRPELDWTKRLPERVCSSIPEAYTVSVTQAEQHRTVRCG